MCGFTFLTPLAASSVLPTGAQRTMLHLPPLKLGLLEEHLRLLRAMALPVARTHSWSPLEQRRQARLLAQAKHAYMQQRKAATKVRAAFPGKQVRRISFVSHQPQSNLDDNSTIVMTISRTLHEDLDFEGADIDEIFEDSVGPSTMDLRREQEYRSPVPSNFVPSSFLEPDPIRNFPVVSPQRQVSEAKSSARQRFTRSAHTRKPTPKQAGLSTWDDISSVASLSRMGSYEPEPLPVGYCPIPSTIFVPTCTTTVKEEESFEPLAVFPPGQFSLTPPGAAGGRKAV